MKNIVLTALILSMCSSVMAFENNLGWKPYYSTSGTVYIKQGNDISGSDGSRYTKQGNNIYSSNGSQYTQLGNTIQNNATGKTYQINNDLIQPLY